MTAADEARVRLHGMNSRGRQGIWRKFKVMAPPATSRPKRSNNMLHRAAIPIEQCLDMCTKFLSYLFSVSCNRHILSSVLFLFYAGQLRLYYTMFDSSITSCKNNVCWTKYQNRGTPRYLGRKYQKWYFYGSTGQQLISWCLLLHALCCVIFILVQNKSQFLISVLCSDMSGNFYTSDCSNVVLI